VTDCAPPRIVLISKPGCHLCDQAREVITRVALELGVQWAERSILDDPELSAAYREQIPVTLVDGIQHDYWRVDESRLRAALCRAQGDGCYERVTSQVGGPSGDASHISGIWRAQRLCARVHKHLPSGVTHALQLLRAMRGSTREEPIPP